LRPAYGHHTGKVDLSVNQGGTRLGSAPYDPNDGKRPTIPALKFLVAYLRPEKVDE